MTYLFTESTQCFYDCYIIFTIAYGRDLNAKEHFQCGLIAGLLACIVTQPMDVVKTQMQLNSTRYQGTMQCITTILKESGFAGFTRGVVPRLMRKSLISALSWTLFEEIMKLNVKVKWFVDSLVYSVNYSSVYIVHQITFSMIEAYL